MSIEKRLYEMLQQNALGVPKDKYSRERITRVVGEILSETANTWFVPCTHSPSPQATTEQIHSVEQALGFVLPQDLHHLWLQMDGGKFYIVPRMWLRDTFPEARHVRYHIFSTLELVTINQNLLKDFRAMLGNDPDFRDLHTLNYVAFCDAHDGNYLAILREGPEQGKVFFLDHEYLFRPYSERDADLYYTVAESLKAWLELVAKTKGWGGFGRGVPPL